MKKKKKKKNLTGFAFLLATRGKKITARPIRRTTAMSIR